MSEKNPMFSPMPKMSMASKSRKTIVHLQKMKDEGTPIVQHCPSMLGPLFTMAADMAGVDICRLPPSDGVRQPEEALKVFKMAYEYQENGMKAMSVELVPIEVSNIIAKKLRVPVIGIAAGGVCDGSEMVDADTFGLMSSPASHAKTYGNLLEFVVGAYGAWAEDVRTGAYPEDKHGVHMDEKELEKFTDLVDKF